MDADRSTTSEQRRRRRLASQFRTGIVLLTIAAIIRNIVRLDGFGAGFASNIYVYSGLNLAPSVITTIVLLMMVGPLRSLGRVWQSTAFAWAAWMAFAIAIEELVSFGGDLLLIFGLPGGMAIVMWRMNPDSLGLLMVNGASCVAAALVALGLRRVSLWSSRTRWVRLLVWIMALWSARFGLVAGYYVLRPMKASTWSVYAVMNDVSVTAGWALAAATLGTVAACVVLCARSRWLFERPMRGDACRGCGYDLGGHDGLVCPECGWGRGAEGPAADTGAERDSPEGGEWKGRVDGAARRFGICTILFGFGNAMIAPGAVLLASTWLLSPGASVRSVWWDVMFYVGSVSGVTAVVGSLALCAAALLAHGPLRWLGLAHETAWGRRAGGMFVGAALFIPLWWAVAKLAGGAGPNLSWVPLALVAGGLVCGAGLLGAIQRRRPHLRALRRVRIYALAASPLLVANVVWIIGWWVNDAYSVQLPAWSVHARTAVFVASLALPVVGIDGARVLRRNAPGLFFAHAADRPS